MKLARRARSCASLSECAAEPPRLRRRCHLLLGGTGEVLAGSEAEMVFAPLANGALDNTLGQSAFSWFESPKNQSLDANAEQSFCDFADAYIHVRRRHVALPGRALTGQAVIEPFISLWQEDAQRLALASDETLFLPQDEVWSRFLSSLSVQRSEWVSWLRFQWTPQVFAAFRERVIDWDRQLENALLRVGPAARQAACGNFDVALRSESASPLDARDAVAAFVEYLAPRLEASQVDGAYKAFAIVVREPLAIVAVAYAWNWFLRGARYAGIANGMAVRFHNLRAAVVAERPSEVHRRPIDWAIDWGTILKNGLAEGVIERKSGSFCDLLRAIRRSVQEDTVYAEFLARSDSEKGRERLWWRQNAVGRALIDAGVCAPFSDHTVRGTVLNESARAVVERLMPTQLAFMLKPTYEIVKLVVNSPTARRVEYRIRERFLNKSLWKVFHIPGLE